MARVVVASLLGLHQPGPHAAHEPRELRAQGGAGHGRGLRAERGGAGDAAQVASGFEAVLGGRSKAKARRGQSFSAWAAVGG